MKKIGLLVGNGFTLDFLDSQEVGMHSSFPLKKFKSHSIDYDSNFMDHLPYIKENLLGSHLHDFKAIKNYVDTFRELELEYISLSRAGEYRLINNPKYKDAIDSHVQLRRFLAMSYSVFQIETNKQDMSNWRWVSWLKENKSKLFISISFNYDLVLENALNKAGANFYRVGTNEFPAPLPLIKPHGSIDFDLPSNFIAGTFDPWQITATLNDAQKVQIIPESKWLEPRIEADIISPSLHNIQNHLSWVSRMFDQFYSVAKELDTFVIAGCSYWDVDRPEIDCFLSKLKRRTRIYVIDPVPNPDLKKKIQSFGLSYREVNDEGPPW